MQLDIENEHNDLINELKAEVKEGAIKHALLKKDGSFILSSPSKKGASSAKKNVQERADSSKKLID